MQEPHISEKGKYGRKVCLCIKDLLFKTDGKTSATFEWRFDGIQIDKDDRRDYKMERDKNTYKLTILRFDSNRKGKYECVVSTAEESRASTSVELNVVSGECMLHTVTYCHSCYPNYLYSTIIIAPGNS